MESFIQANLDCSVPGADAHTLYAPASLDHVSTPSSRDVLKHLCELQCENHRSCSVEYKSHKEIYQNGVAELLDSNLVEML